MSADLTDEQNAALDLADSRLASDALTAAKANDKAGTYHGAVQRQKLRRAADEAAGKLRARFRVITE